MRILIIVVVLLVFSGLIILSNNNLALYKSENVEGFKTFYVGWLDRVYANFQVLTGNAVGLDWSPR